MARGKRSLVLDFKKPGSASIFSKLCSDADVLIDPFRPGKSNTQLEVMYSLWFVYQWQYIYLYFLNVLILYILV